MDDSPDLGPGSSALSVAWSPRRRLTSAAIVLAALTGSSALILGRAGVKTSIEHDEGITFIQSAPAMAEWATIANDHIAPAGVWVPASQWQALLQVRDPFAFAQISHGLAQWDIHPPVYFWLLHVWSLVFGMTPTSAIWLGVAISAATGVLLFGFASWAIGDPLPSAAVVAFWALASTTVGVSLIARQYGLFALLTVATSWAALACFGPGRRPRVLPTIGSGVLIGLGLGTHYQFALVVAGLLLWIVISCWRRWSLVLAAVAAALLGLGILALLHHGFWQALTAVSSSAFDGGSSAQRLTPTFSSIFGFFLTPELSARVAAASQQPWALTAALAVATVSLVAGLVLALRSDRRVDAASIKFEDQLARHRVAAVCFVGLWIVATTSALFLVGQSPSHAMGDRYLAAALPLLAFIPVTLFRRLGGTAAAAIGLVWAVASIPGQLATILAPAAEPSVQTLVAPAKRIVIDTLARGVLPRVVIDADPGTLVFAGTQSQLLSDPAAWAGQLEPGDLVLTSSRYIESKEQTVAIRADLKQWAEVEKLDGAWPLTWWRVTGTK